MMKRKEPPLGRGNGNITEIRRFWNTFWGDVNV